MSGSAVKFTTSAPTDRKLPWPNTAGCLRSGGSRYGGRPQAITLRALAAMFMRHAKGHYRKRGQPTSELDLYRRLLRRLVKTFGSITATEFGPLKLRRFRQGMIDDGWTRKSINNQISRVRHVFAWAVGEELVPAATLVALQKVAGLQADRSDAAEPEPIQPVAEADVNAVLPHVSRQVADMVRVQLLTGCRPGEVCAIRPVDVDRTGDVWTYVPASHKTEHHGKQRTIFVGPRAQAILLPYLDRADDAYCFSPLDAEAARHAEQRANRKTPVQPSQRNRKKSQPSRSVGDQYTRDSYRRAIERGCKAAGIDNWSPNRLRHSRLTDLERQYDLELSSIVAGHSTLKTTMIYVQRDEARARAAMAEVG